MTKGSLDKSQRLSRDSIVNPDMSGKNVYVVEVDLGAEKLRLLHFHIYLRYPKITASI